MLISRGLSALALGWSVVARAHFLEKVARQRQHEASAVDVDVYNSSQLSAFIDRYLVENPLQLHVPARRIRLEVYEERTTARTGSSRIHARQEGQCSTGTPVFCTTSGKDGLACPGCTSCCPDGKGSFKCCAAGFRCCTSSLGVGSCCPSNGATCGLDGSCQSSP